MAAVFSNNIVGLASVFLLDPTIEDDSQSLLDEFAVHSSYQGYGIGESLIYAVLGYATAHKRTNMIHCPVPDSLPFFRRLGFYDRGQDVRFDIKL